MQGGKDRYLGFVNTRSPPLSAAEALKKWSTSRDGLCPPRCACLQPHPDWGVSETPGTPTVCTYLQYTWPELGLSSSRATGIGKSAPCSIHVACDCSELIEDYQRQEEYARLHLVRGRRSRCRARDGLVRDVIMLPRSLLRNRCRGLVCDPNGELWTAARAGVGSQARARAVQKKALTRKEETGMYN